MDGSQYIDSRKEMYTCRSGGRQTQIDMCIVRKTQWKLVDDATVLPSETVGKQHKPLIVTVQFKRFQRKELCSSETRIRSGKLRGPKAEEYRRKVIDRRAETEDGETAEEMWRKLKEITVRTAEEVCGRSKYGKKPDREEWWWGGAVQDAIKRKKDARAEFELNPSDASMAHSKRANKAAKRAVAETKASAQAELYDELENQPDRWRKRRSIRLPRAEGRSRRTI